MTHPTCAVRCAIRDQAGNPAAGAEITAILNRAEVHDGYLIPARVSAVADAAGEVVLPLWPNVLGAAGSAYQVLIKHPGGTVLRTTAVVPDLDHVDLHLIAELPALPARTPGQLLIDSAISASQATLQQIQATQAEVDQAMSEADAAIQQMADHAASAASAADTAQAAAAAATDAQDAAAGQAVAAAQSATAAGESQSAAAASQSSATQSQNAAAQSASAAEADREAAETARTGAEGLYGDLAAIDEAVQLTYANRAIVDIAISTNLIILAPR